MRRTFGEQLWAAHGIELITENLVRRAGRRRAGVANCEISLVGVELHDPVHTNDRQRDICVAPRATKCKPRDQPTAGESASGRYAERLCLRFGGE